VRAILFSALAAMAACQEVPERLVTAEPVRYTGGATYFGAPPSVWADPDTGCEYLIINNGYGSAITARSQQNSYGYGLVEHRGCWL